MVERKGLIALLFCVLLLPLLCGCPYETEVPLSTPSRAKIDKELIGCWKSEPMNEEEKPGIVVFCPFNDHEFIAVTRETKEEEDDIDLMKAFVTILDDTKFLNVQELDLEPEEKKWLLVEYSVSGDYLTLRVVDDKLFKQTFTTSRALRKFLKDNLKNPELYQKDDKVVLKRIKE